MAHRFSAYIRDEAMPTPFCPGCGHGILMNAILRAIEGLSIPVEEMLFVSGIGCAAWIPSPHFKADTLHTLHGRAVAFATGAKLFNPKLKVIVISGDGDLASIGGNHLIHGARRNIDMSVICANNCVYGMTGGQLASTTPRGAVTETSPAGNAERPFDLCDLVKAAGAGYVARYGVIHPSRLVRSIQKAVEHRGFSFIEVLSSCPTHYGRRNRLPSPYAMLMEMKRRCVSVSKAEKMAPEERADKIVIGEFVNDGDR